jgi:uncharacterized membrane protein YccF (DUF307 family)
MSCLGNALWILFGGWLIALEYLFGGIVLCLTIVGIPFGVACFRIAGLALLPFGKEIVQSRAPEGCLVTGATILWIAVAGLWIAISHVVIAAVLALTIIGIPFALQHLKLATLSLMPFGAHWREAGW